MKTIEELLKQPAVYLHNWSCKEDVISDFNNDDIYHNQNILFASYGTDNYEGDAFVLYESEGLLYEVNADHCSCYGLEGQFDPRETTLIELRHRLLNGRFGTDDWSDNCFAQELREFLGIQDEN